MGVGGETPRPGHFLIVGPSGSGVTTALDFFNDFGHTMVGGVRPEAFEATYRALAPVSDRLVFTLSLSPESAASVEELTRVIQTLRGASTEGNGKSSGLKLLYLDSPHDVLVRRYMDSGKRHPFESAGLARAVAEERALYEKIKPIADYTIETGSLPREELRNKVAKILGLSATARQLTVHLTSFGFKYGAPLDAELLFDMRFLKNPFYDESLRPLTGLDQPVRDYIFSFPQAQTFLDRWTDLVGMMLPHYLEEGKTRLTVAIGCTGGQHRSVCMTESLAAYLREAHPGYNIVVTHRERAGWPTVSESAQCRVPSAATQTLETSKTVGDPV